MKITKNQLRQIIQEEMAGVLREEDLLSQLPTQFTSSTTPRDHDFNWDKYTPEVRREWELTNQPDSETGLYAGETEETAALGAMGRKRVDVDDWHTGKGMQTIKVTPD
jgi:hypothetical protein